MLNLERLKKIQGIFDECFGRGETIENCQEFNDCNDCLNSNLKWHAEMIEKFNTISSTCPTIKWYIGSSHCEKCSTDGICDTTMCKKEVIKWLKENFRDVFNDIQRRKDEENSGDNDNSNVIFIPNEENGS